MSLQELVMTEKPSKEAVRKASEESFEDRYE